MKPYLDTSHFSSRAFLLLACLISGLITMPVLAQTEPASTNPSIDANGVDVIDGSFNYTKTDISIGSGEPELGGLKYVRLFGKTGWSDNLKSRIIRKVEGAQTFVYVTYGNQSEKFLQTGTTYTPVVPNGNTLTSAVAAPNTNYTYTTRDGTAYSYTEHSSGSSLGIRLAGIVYPSKDKETYHYKAVTFSSVRYERLQSVTTNTSWQLKFTYASNGLNAGTISDWQRISSVKTINNVVSFCDPLADSCSTPESWPEAIYTEVPSAGGTIRTSADPVGSTWTYTQDSNGRLAAIRRPGSISDDIVVTYGVSGKVSSLSKNGDVFSYNFADAGNERTATVTDPNQATTLYKSAIAEARLTSVTDATGRTTSYQYDASGRLFKFVQPEGNFEQYDRDARGNVTTLRKVAKSGSGLADIVETFGYDATCTNVLKCNKPNSYTDARGNITTFTYNINNGAISGVRKPTLSNGQQIRRIMIYLVRVAKVKNASGTLVDQPTSVYRMTSDCWTTIANCLDSGEKATFTYEPASNLMRGVIVDSAANGSLPLTSTLGYDNVGNVTLRDGPYPGTSDTTRTRFDLARRVIGRILPDPDGAGPRLHASTRVTLNGLNLPTLVELGTVNGQSDADWAAFAPSSAVAYEYDSAGRQVKSSTTSGGVIYDLEQTSYDPLSRIDCVATRMNPAVFGALPSSACVLTPSGLHGNDRIKKYSYDPAGRRLSVTEALGTAEQSVEMAYSYSPNGLLATQDDGENNRTTYVYDGYDRRLETRFPVNAQGALSSSTTDREQLGYDAASNVTSRVLRDGTVIQFTYDEMNRLTFKDLPSGETDTSYTYDLRDRMLSAVQGSSSLGWAFNENGNVISASSPLGSISYEYNTSGQMTKMTWPDGFYVNYEYDALKNITAIREYGATSGAGVLATYSYDNFGQRATVTRGNGTTTSYMRDAISRIAAISHDLAGSVNDLTLSGMAYNPVHQIVSQDRSNDGYAWNGHYNVSRAYGVNGLNQTTFAAATSFSYDGRGNLTNSGSATFGYSSENLLKSGPGGVTLDYDAALRLSQTSIGGSATRFLYSGNDVIAEFSGSNALLRRYVFGPNMDEPIVWYEGSGTSTKRWYHQDERKSVIAVSDINGSAFAINSYDEYGIPASTNVGRFQYTGQMWIPEVGLHYFKSRMYSPNLGRFMQTDPVGYADGVNLYNYSGQDPINLVDRTGLTKQKDDLITVTGSLLDYLLFDLNDLLLDTNSNEWLSRQALRTQGDPAKKKVNQARRRKNQPYKCQGPPPAPGTGSDAAELMAQTRINAKVARANSSDIFWFRDQVRNKGPWDYKQYDRGYVAYGNYNYGYTGAALGLGSSFILRQAGRAQQAAGTSKPEWGDPGPFGLFGGQRPYGDDPDDRALILRGIQDYENGC